MVTEPLQYGIVGCAGIGGTHADAIKATERAELVACCDIDEAIASEFASDHDIESAYTDVTTMIEDGVEAITVGTPSGTHGDIAIEAAQAGGHVLTEKPMDVYLEKIDEMTEAAEAADVTLGCIFQKRTFPSSQFAKSCVDDGSFGKFILGDTTVKWYRTQGYYDQADWRGTRAMDGGCLMNQAIHNIDKLQWLAGGVESVYAHTDTMVHDMEMEDVAVIALTFENGGYGTIEATTNVQGGQSQTEINGTEGSITLDGREITHLETEDDLSPPDTGDGGWGDGHQAAIEDFTEAVLEGRDPMVPPAEARKAVEIIVAAYQSAEEDRRVEIAELRE